MVFIYLFLRLFKKYIYIYIFFNNIFYFFKEKNEDKFELFKAKSNEIANKQGGKLQAPQGGKGVHVLKSES